MHAKDDRAGSAAARLRPLLALALAALALATLASCGRESRVLARVGNRTITVGEFLDYARLARARYPWLPDTAKRVLLDDLVRRELMLSEAEERGLLRSDMVNALRQNAEREVLVNALSSQLAPPDVPVSPAEVEQDYAWHRTEHHVQLILAQDPATARHAMALLESGTPFDRVALELNVTGLVPPTGDIGWVPGGALPEPLDTRVREARVGEVIGPLKVGTDSWFIARVLERRPAQSLPPLKAARQQLLEQVRDRKHRTNVQRLVETLKAEYHFALEPGAAQELFAHVNGMATDTTATTDTSLVLARYDGPRGREVYTLADAMADLQNQPDRPNPSSVPALAHWIESRVVQRLVLIEAKHRHLHEEPQNAHRIEDRVEAAILQSMYENDVNAQAEITEEDMRAEFARRIQGQPMPYESMPPEVKEQLRTLTIETKRAQRMHDLTEALRRKYPVVVNEDLLRRLEWPAPALDITPQQG